MPCDFSYSRLGAVFKFDISKDAANQSINEKWLYALAKHTFFKRVLKYRLGLVFIYLIMYLFIKGRKYWLCQSTTTFCQVPLALLANAGCGSCIKGN